MRSNYMCKYISSIFLFFVCNVLALSAQSLPQQTNCADKYETIRSTKIQQLYAKSDEACLIFISSRNHYDTLIYRNYLVSNQGSLQIFISAGDGPEETSTGAKEIYFFPRFIKEQNYTIDGQSDLIRVQTAFAADMVFDAHTSDLLSAENMQVTVDEKISLENDAGIRMMPTRGVIYDLPFTVGKSPSTVMNLTGYFKDAYGQKCKVKVAQIFDKAASGDTDLKYNDEEIRKFLNINCAHLKY